ncbi:hypothetical protein [Flavobacterium psychrophilum]|uniref:Uncharacterized protein n=1 Tax=Flavobacterium psychrophilum TaxID=96345 RepID=A0A7U2RAJ3_FLAPS|nr:hypothetical protein [Flavobacterium psychrophilum]QRE03527.1 hypothetical protein H0H26_11645 [Flavobacterium psychrophilum]
MYLEVKNTITKLQIESNNSCGTTLLNLVSIIKISQTEIIPILNLLHKEKHISVRKGINGNLIFLKTYDKNN